jgi:site-specific recombinase XerD
MEALIDKGYAIGTLNRFEILERHITSFLLEKHKVADWSIKKNDHAFIGDFEFYLRTEKSCAHNTAIKYVKNLCKILRICVSLKWIDRDPMLGYKLRSKNVERPFLSEDELQCIAAKEFSTDRLMKVRDNFSFLLLYRLGLCRYTKTQAIKYYKRRRWQQVGIY